MRILLAFIVFLAFPGFALSSSLTVRQSIPAYQDIAPVAVQWYVNGISGNDSNSCLSADTACKTIAAAILKAANGDTIILAAGNHPLNNLQIDKALTLQGKGQGITTLDGEGKGRLLYTTSPSTLVDLTIRNGAIITPSFNIFDTGGGAILSSGDLTLRRVSVVENSTVGSGGAIFNLGDLVIEDSRVMSNTSEGNGGGIYNYSFGTITINRSLLAGNTANGQSGGAIESYKPIYLTDVTIQDNQSANFAGGLSIGGVADLNRVTLQGNRASSGAALFATSGVITLTNSTVSGNIANNNYGGIQLSGAAVSLFLQNSTIAYNTRTNSAGAGFNGLVASNSPVRIVNSIFAFNSDRNCGGTTGNFTSDGHNLSSDFTCDLTQTGDLQGVDPLLGPLAEYGGETPLHPLLAGSPAIDAGDNTQCPGVDQRLLARPYDGDGNSSALCDIGAFEARQQLAISDVTIGEGNSGSSTALFTVTLTPPAVQSVTVDYATQPDSASPGSDYTTASGTLTFGPGESAKTIPVAVKGDTADEQDETFTVVLSNASGADLVDGIGLGTIVDDDGLSTLSVDDRTVLEGNSGTVDSIFTVSLSPASAQDVTVAYTTQNGTASEGADFDAASGTLTFTPGQTTQSVTVKVRGDVTDEGESEGFSLILSSPTGATLADGVGAGVITDDDTARLSQTLGPSVLEGNSGQTPMVFVVNLSTPAAFVVTVDYEVNSGVGVTGAVEDVDFVDTSGTLTFQPSDTSKSYTVQVIGDTEHEEDEVFSTLISNGTVAITVNGAIGHILNDDNGVIHLPLITK